MSITSSLGLSGVLRRAQAIGFNVPAIKSTNVQDAVVEVLANDNSQPTNFIYSGGKFGVASGFDLPISARTESISHKTLVRSANTITLLPRRAALVVDKLDGTTVPIYAVDPLTFVDNNTVVFYKPDGSTTCSNLAKGISSIAVDNDLTKSGTIVPVAGRDGGYGAKSDGISGGYVSTNYTGFPIGAAERELNILWTAKATSDNFLLQCGNNFYVEVTGTRIKFNNSTTAYDTQYDFIEGQVILLTFSYDGTTFYFKVNGFLVYSLVIALTTTATSLYLFRQSTGYYTGGTMHFVELRNKMRTSQSLMEMASKMLIPVCYDYRPASTYPIIKASDKALAWHEWLCDETSGTAVVDTAGTLSGTASGTSVVDSEIGIGKARKFNGTSDYINLGTANLTFPMTIFGVVNLPSNAEQAIIDARSSASLGWALLPYNGKLRIYSNGEVSSDTTVPTGVPIFLAVTVNSSKELSLYANTKTPEFKTLSTFNSVSTNVTIGKCAYGSSQYFGGKLEGLWYVPRDMSQSEVADLYDSLMPGVTRKSMKSVIPADAIVIGSAETDSTSIIKKNDTDWKYGRRDGATCGNRVVVQDYKSIITSTPDSMQWTPPFGFGAKFRIDWLNAENTTGLNEFVVPALYRDGDGTYRGVLISNYKNGNIGAYVGAGVSFVGNTYRSGGYLRPIFTCLEDDAA